MISPTQVFALQTFLEEYAVFQKLDADLGSIYFEASCEKFTLGIWIGDTNAYQIFRHDKSDVFRPVTDRTEFTSIQALFLVYQSLECPDDDSIPWLKVFS